MSEDLDLIRLIRATVGFRRSVAPGGGGDGAAWDGGGGGGSVGTVQFRLDRRRSILRDRSISAPRQINQQSERSQSTGCAHLAFFVSGSDALTPPAGDLGGGGWWRLAVPADGDPMTRWCSDKGHRGGRWDGRLLRLE